MMEELSHEMEIKKPFVVVSCNQVRQTEYRLIQEREIFDYEFGV